MSEKLQKALARAGLGSRREIEGWISEGRLSVNGVIATLGERVTIKDDIRLDGRKLRLLAEALINRKVLMYHKPEGQITTRKDPEGRDTVFDQLPTLRGSRWVAIGRLDLNTSGLLLFTNDGELANRLMHPKHEVVREYAVRIMGELTPSVRRKLQDGVMLDDGIAKFNSIESKGGTGANKWYHVTLSEGRTREVRRLFEAVNLMVSRLIRVRYGPVQLDPMLKQGMMRELDKTELDTLCDLVGLEPQASKSERRRDVAEEKGRLHSEEKVALKQARRSAVLSGDAPKPRLSKRAQAIQAYEETKGQASEKAPRSARRTPVLRESELKKIAIEKQRERAEKAEKASRFSGEDKSKAKASPRSSTSRTTRASEPEVRAPAKRVEGRSLEDARRARRERTGGPSERRTRRTEETDVTERPRRVEASPFLSDKPKRRSVDEAPRPRSARSGAPSERRPRRDDESSFISERPKRRSTEDAPRSRGARSEALSERRPRRDDESSFISERPKRRSSEDAPRTRSGRSEVSKERAPRASTKTAGNRSTRTHAAREPGTRAPRKSGPKK